jgi:hypothetical protein
MQLTKPTPTKAVRQARSASRSSERRTPGTAAIKVHLQLDRLLQIASEDRVQRLPDREILSPAMTLTTLEYFRGLRTAHSTEGSSIRRAVGELNIT